MANGREMEHDEDDTEPAFGFRIHLQQQKGGIEVKLRWLQGKDSVLFESFCGMLKRQLTLR